MAYHLEELGPERFQMLCQAVLLTVKPYVQCLPVGQPDGGRDAFIRGVNEGDVSDSIIFQVKYVRSPLDKDARDLIKQVVASERDKVAELISRGATEYHLMTNVAGTSHLDVGSIDLVNKELSELLGVNSFCWWRGEIERKIDTCESLKWSYPEILKATDLIGALLRRDGDSESSRRTDVIKRYMAHQASYDAQLKFKQVELQKNIFDLFVDVPAQFEKPVTEQQRACQYFLGELLERDVNPLIPVAGSQWRETDVLSFGAMRLMAAPEFAKSLDRVVIEGAPGQGKSTVTQYLCQVNRMVLLGRADAIKRISKEHLPLEARIPFRVDLRDYANWLSGRNPFGVTPGSSLSSDCSPILESFLSAQVASVTGCQFTVDDLVSVSQASQILVVLDGFDEVADIAIRNKMVSEIGDSSVRMSEVALSSQIIVTSRPAAFANSPGFSRVDWQHIYILPLSREVIKEYSLKWLEGRASDDHEKKEIINVLEEKLEHSHVRDLARNPMQLAILLSLISVQGASLPDKRTALYDNYVEIFLNRESEKSKVVRDYRELLVKMHRYLAWRLQSEAEHESGAGNVSEIRLRQVLKDFLDDGGHSTDLVDKLFTGMVERVVALVSRVQGTFEFEVQPLREYFAARFLHDTAPYISAVIPHKGALPDRFDAISRNFYWLNVTRFYSGCYSSGELSSLVDGLSDISSDAKLGKVAYGVRLSLTLLQDYVFSQHPKLAVRVAENMIRSQGFFAFLAWAGSRDADEGELSVPAGRGQDLLVEYCIERLWGARSLDLIYCLGKFILSNRGSSEIYRIWIDYVEEHDDFKSVFAVTTALEVIYWIESEEIELLVEKFGDRVFPEIFRYRSWDVGDNAPTDFLEKYKISVINSALDDSGRFLSVGREDKDIPLEVVVALVFEMIGASYFSREFGRNEALSIRDLLSKSPFFSHVNILTSNGVPSSQLDGDDLSDLKNLIFRVLESSAAEMSKNISSWSDLLEGGRARWGERWSFYAAGINLLSLLDDTAGDGFGSEGSICYKASQFRRNRGDLSWWRNSFGQSAPIDMERAFMVLGALTWMSANDLFELADVLSSLVSSLDERTWNNLKICSPYLPNEKLDELPEGFYDISPEYAALLIKRFNVESRAKIWKQYLADATTQHATLHCEICDIGASLLESKLVAWEELLPVILRGAEFGYQYYHYWEGGERIYMSIDMANDVLANPAKYPVRILREAEDAILKEVGAASIPVGEIAQRDGWFTEGF